MPNDLVKSESAEQVLAKYDGNSLPAAMATHHPIHGLFGAAFEEVGGHQALVQWARENYGDFIKIFAKMAPPANPDINISKMSISVAPELRRTPLDGELE